MNESGAALWKLLVKKKKINGLLPTTKNLKVKWWTEDIHINLNKVEMIRKRMKLSTFEEKPIHFLMET